MSTEPRTTDNDKEWLRYVRATVEGWTTVTITSPSGAVKDLHTHAVHRDAMLRLLRLADAAAERASGGLDSEALRFAKALTEYGTHHGNCPYESWNKAMSRCKCGLFALIKAANRLPLTGGQDDE